MHMNERFEKWWEEYGSGPYTSIPQTFEGGWGVGFNEASEKANTREKLILEALRPDLPEDFDLDKVIVNALTKETEKINDPS